MLQEIRSFAEQLDQLPTLSPVAVKLIDAASQPDIGLRDISRLISADQSVAARLLRIANSAAFGFGEVRTLERATSLLGLDMVRSAALSVIVMDMFRGAEKTSFDLAAFWRHSAACAIGSEALAKRLNYPEPREAFLAGLLHDIGKSVLHLWNPDLYCRIVDEACQTDQLLLEVEERTLGVGHTWAARLLMEKWRFPEALTSAAWLHHQPMDELQESGQTLAWIVSSADNLCQLFHFGWGGNPCCQLDLEDVSEASGLSINQLLDISTEILQRYDEVAAQFDWSGKAEDLCRDSIAQANRQLSRLQLRLKERNLQLNRRRLLLGAVSKLQEACRPPLSADQALERAVQLAPSAVPTRKAAAFFFREGRSEITGCLLTSPDQAPQPVALPLDEKMAGARLTRLNQRDQLSALIQSLRSQQTPQAAQILDLLHSPGLAVMPLQDGRGCLGQLLADLECSEKEREQAVEDLRHYAQTAAMVLDQAAAASEADRRQEEMARMARQARSMGSRLFQAERLASVGRLAAGAAHEINNPLTIITAQAQLLAAKSGSPEERKALENVLSQSERIAKIVKDLMGLARPAKPRIESTDLAVVLERTLDVLKMRIRTCGIRVDTCIDSAVPRILADPKQLEQVFLNLAINAVQAMKQGGVLKIRVCSNGSAGAETVSVRFTDTGHGIDEQHLQTIFDPFFSTKGEGEGLGLGLAICHSIVKGHGGKLSVASRKGAGTTFTIKLPCRPGTPASLPAAASERPVLGFPALGKDRPRVLVVDDEQDLAGLLSDSLRCQGYRADAACDAPTALQRVAQIDYDAALLDLKMPGTNGLELMKQLRRQSPSLPVILMTGSTDPQDLQAAQGADAAAFLSKPFQPAQLGRTIEAVLQSSSRSSRRDAENTEKRQLSVVGSQLSVANG